jgi:predicted nucleic acid-binding protein
VTVVDASILTAYFVASDPNHASVRAWIGRALEEFNQLHAPTLALPETCGAIRRRTRSVTLGDRALATLTAMPALTLHPVTVALARRAAAIAVGIGVKGCDATYIALSQQLDETLLTLDIEQRQRGASVARTATPD